MRYLIGQALTFDDKYGSARLGDAFGRLPRFHEATAKDFAAALTESLSASAPAAHDDAQHDAHAPRPRQDQPDARCRRAPRRRLPRHPLGHADNRAARHADRHADAGRSPASVWKSPARRARASPRTKPISFTGPPCACKRPPPRGGRPAGQSGLHIRLHKRIPSQAGLGGGSSDAAATLLAVNELLGLALSPARLAEIGAALGADVPFFLTGGTALVEGLGERVTPLPPLAPPWPLVIVKPPVGVSTAAAYAALDALPGRRAGDGHGSVAATARDALSNDFESVILPAYPEIAAAHACSLRQAEPTKVSGRCSAAAASCVFRRVSDEPTRRKGWRTDLRTAALGKVWVTTTMGAEGDS